jgi:hypothetical protein
MKNASALDRYIRLIFAVILFEAAYFWLPSPWQIVATVLGVVMLVTAAVGFCPLYRLAGICTKREGAKQPAVAMRVAAAVLLAVVLAGGSYASNFFSRKIFLEDYNTMNNYYKQALFLTGKNERAAAVQNYDRLVPEYARFQAKYTAYHPHAVKGDGQFDADLAQISTLIAAPANDVRTGDLHAAHLALEKVRPVFQEMFKRNHFSMLSIALVEFHDVMELILDAANAKAPDKVIALYPQVSDTLKTVESETNDQEIQAIRKNLEAVLTLAKDAKSTELPAASEALKASFVKVYLKRG